MDVEAGAPASLADTVAGAAISVAQAAVRVLLRQELAAARRDPSRPSARWKTHGLGMVRCSLGDGQGNLHVWDPRLRYDPAPSEYHTHQFGFASFVASGRVADTTYVEAGDDGEAFWRRTTGPASTLAERTQPVAVRLRVAAERSVGPGETYALAATDVHLSRPEPGSVTVIRLCLADALDRTYVYGPEGTEFGRADARQATNAEVFEALGLALAKWSSAA